MYEAARAYSEQFAYRGREFPVIDEDSKCLLCQQPLGNEAQDRFRRFNAFVAGEVARKVESSKTNWEASVLAFRLATQAIVPLSATLDSLLKSENEQIRNLIVDFLAEAISYRGQIEQFVVGDDVAYIGDPPKNCLPKVDAFLEDIRTSIAAAEAILTSDENLRLRNELAELQARQLLNQNKQQITVRLSQFRGIAKLIEAMKACGTTGISTKGTELIKQYVTGEFESALASETASLSIDNIPLRLISSSSKGTPKHQLKIDQTTFSGNTSTILSEGEHRAVALATFLAEQSTRPGSAPIVIDDPVSSLDHVRRQQVASRLTQEAQKRQVIVFTHDLLFYTAACFDAAEKQVALTRIALMRGPEGYGTVEPDGDPWAAKLLGRRRAWLEKQLSRLKTIYESGNSDQYEKEAKFFYDRLRETWERLIEEGLFANVVVRYRPSVQTRTLPEAVLDDSIVARVYNAMSIVSEYTAHDRPAAAGASWPNPTIMEQHLKDLVKCIDEVKRESKAAGDRRKKLEQPPTAVITSKAAS